MEEKSFKRSRLSNIPENSMSQKEIDPDEQVLREFRMKYQKSLEAIQSLQEILELKKEMGLVNHSYDPVCVNFLAFTLFTL